MVRCLPGLGWAEARLSFFVDAMGGILDLVVPLGGYSVALL
jgi:hypothetical protein